MGTVLLPRFDPGLLVTNPMMSAFEKAVKNIVGNSFSGLLGVASANVLDAPLTVVPASGMNVVAGGAGNQKVMLNSADGPRIIDSVPTLTIAVNAANSTNPRRDLIVATYVAVDIADGTGSFKTIDPDTSAVTVSTATKYTTKESLSWTYVAGTAASSPVDPTVPTNGVPIARITVPAGATSITSDMITPLLGTMQSAILGGISGYVKVTDDQSIAGVKTFTAASTVMAGMTFLNSGGLLAGPGLRKDVGGNVILSPLASRSIYLGYDAQSMASVIFGPNGTWGNVDGVGFHNADNTAIYGKNTVVNSGYIRAGALPTGNFPAGSIMSNLGNNNGRYYFGADDSNYLWYDGTTYRLVGDGGGLTTNGAITGTNGFYLSADSNGKAVQTALSFGNPSRTGGYTNIGSFGSPIRGVASNVLAITASGGNGAQVLALSDTGGVGANSFFARSFFSTARADTIVEAAANPAAFIFTNGTAVGANTQIGSSGSSVGGTSATALSVFNSGTSKTLFGIDGLGNTGIGGNLGIAGGIAADGPIAGGTHTVRGAVYVGAQAGGGLQNGDLRVTRDSDNNTGIIYFGNSGSALQLLGQQYEFTQRKLSAASVDFTTGNEGSFRRVMAIANVGTTSSPGQTNLGLRIPGPSNQQYNVYATITTDLADSRSHSLTGSGISWTRNNVTQQDIGGPMTIEIFGTATGGQIASVNYSCPEISGNSLPGLLRVEATPTYS